MEFEWDPQKDRANQKKHGVSFEVAMRVFADPLRKTALERVVDGEERWQTIGMVEGILLLLVAHTWEGDDPELIRIISARKAEPSERRGYEHEQE
jgi:uncharacterized DUF497 family protein